MIIHFLRSLRIFYSKTLSVCRLSLLFLFWPFCSRMSSSSSTIDCSVCIVQYPDCWTEHQNSPTLPWPLPFPLTKVRKFTAPPCYPGNRDRKIALQSAVDCCTSDEHSCPVHSTSLLYPCDTALSYFP